VKEDLNEVTITKVPSCLCVFSDTVGHDKIIILKEKKVNTSHLIHFILDKVNPH
jgi:hypothetical protein